MQRAFDGQFESAPAQPVEAVAAKSYPWILNPFIDIMFACGGMMWLLWFVVEKMGVQRSLATPQGAIIWVLWVMGVHFFANDHAFIGWHRVATSKYIDPKVRKNLAYLAIFLGIMLFPVILIPGWAAVAAKIYVLWLVQHYAAQAYGITLLYCMKREYKMSKMEKECLHLVFRMLMAMVIIRAMTFPVFSGEFFEQFKLPFWGPLPVWLYNGVVVAFAASILVFAGMVIYKFIKQKLLFPFPALMNTVSIIGIYLVSQYAAEPVLSVIMAAYFHGTQNFVIGTAVQLKERGLPENVPASKISSLLFKPYTILYFSGIVVSGVLLMVVLPRLLVFLSVPLSVTIAGVFAMQGYHHFITESVVWKLRHPDIRKIMLA